MGKIKINHHQLIPGWPRSCGRITSAMEMTWLCRQSLGKRVTGNETQTWLPATLSAVVASWKPCTWNPHPGTSQSLIWEEPAWKTWWDEEWQSWRHCLPCAGSPSKIFRLCQSYTLVRRASETAMSIHQVLVARTLQVLSLVPDGNTRATTFRAILLRVGPWLPANKSWHWLRGDSCTSPAFLHLPKNLHAKFWVWWRFIWILLSRH